MAVASSSGVRRSTVLGAFVLLSIAVSSEARQPALGDASFSLTVALSAGPHLSPTTVKALRSEVERIWCREGIVIEWLAGDEPRPPVAPLRLEVGRYRLSPSNAGGRVHVLAEFHRADSRIVANTDVAETVVRQGLQARRLQWPASEQPCILGRVLGRAVAHEIGHYLLGSAAHARTGLMQPTFSARELVDPESPAFS